ncbi:T9SS type A sorting domain-containing protein [Lacinutrix sp. WUR7]|uniref:LamG-like jellyroll fold domain-containing protein n=1 Tax=Lacinutrix sp. WUR7 TaxID=2653681 RepID=UPI00193CE49F|nr:LamG-like jellyroll fold domain-containing protein [Lacinutrix sp. WUR7]QRM87708.1 T9SS type A sorting domain-containing protein [Lacinutrix sp. WUR7]
MKSKFYFFILVFLCQIMSYGQTLDQSNTDSPFANDREGWGQGFTAGLDGTLSQFNFQYYNLDNPPLACELKIYEGGGNSGTLLATEAFTLTAASDAEYEISISTTVNVTSGQLYTAYITTVDGVSKIEFGLTSGATYADGLLYALDGSTITGFDLWFKTFVVEAPDAPTASDQAYCIGATVENLEATGSNLQWYISETETTALNTTTVLATGTYYVSQTIDGIESSRTAVNVTINNAPDAPTVTTPIIYNQGDTATPLSATTAANGTGLLWYTVATEGVDYASITPSTATLGNTSYWVVSTNDAGCESEREEVVVTVNDPLPATHLNFDGLDVVDLSDHLTTHFVGKDAVTLEAWVRPETNTGFGTIVSNYSFPINNSEFQMLLRRDGNNYVVALNIPSFAILTVTASNTVTTNTWQHVAASYDGSTVSIYVDGVLISSTTANGAFGNVSSNFVIGGNARTEDFIGDIDEVRIWDVARTASQIDHFKYCELQSSEIGLVAYYPFNQGDNAQDNTAESMLTNASSNAISGTLIGFPLTGTTGNFLAGSPMLPQALIVEQPQDLTFSDTDNSVSFSIVASGVASYQWEYSLTGEAPGGSPAPEGWMELDDSLTDPDVSGATTQTLTFAGDNLDTLTMLKFRVVLNGQSNCSTISNEVIASQTLDVNQIDMQNSIRVYPNPTNGVLTISNTLNTDFEVAVYDMNGRALLHENYNQENNHLDLSNFSQGIYLLKIKSRFGEISKRVIKQ